METLPRHTSRRDFLHYLQTHYKDRNIMDTPTSAGPLLDLVDKGIVRIGDNMIPGADISATPGANWHKSYEQQVTQALALVVNKG